MYVLTTKSDFDSAHFLKDYPGKCANIHGHRWTVTVDVRCESVAETGSYRGMVVDFSRLKKDLKAETENLDHHLIMETGSLRQKTLDALHEEGFQLIEIPYRPTAENLARYFFAKMKEKGYDVARVSVYETPDNCASYMED